MTSSKLDCMHDDDISRDGFLLGRGFYLLLVCIACFLLFPFVFTRFWLHFNNSIHNSDRWNPTRCDFEDRSPGAYVHMFSRYVYAGNRLNLNCGYGVPEHLYHEPLTLKRLAFDFRVPEGGEISFVFGRNEGQFSGLCLSASPEKDSMFFTASIDGQFRSVSRIKSNSIKEPDTWHRAEFQFNQERIKCFVNGELFFSGAGTGALPYGLFGFRSTLLGAVVDNVEIESSEYIKVIKEDFRNRRKYARVFSFGCIVMSVLMFLFFVLFCVGYHYSPGRILFRMTVFQSCVLLLLILLHLADFFYVGHRIPSRDYIRHATSWTPNPHHRYLRSPFVLKWLWLFGDYAAHDISDTDCRVRDDRIRRRRTEILDDNGVLMPDLAAYRVLFVCGEQAFCEERGDGGYIWQVRDYFDRYKPVPGKNVMCINASSSDSCIGGPLREAYFDRWIHMKPSVMVIGVGRSGSCCTIGDEVVREVDVYVKYNNSRNIKTVLLFEANNPQIETVGVEHARESVFAKQEEWGVEIIDLDSFMREINDTGFCWLDEYQISAYGHQRAGEFVAKRLREIVSVFGDSVKNDKIKN